MCAPPNRLKRFLIGGHGLLLPADERLANLLHELHLDSAHVAGERNAIALPWAVCQQRVCEDRAVFIASRHAHRILNGNRFAKNIAVADVARLFLRVQIQFRERLVLVQHKGEGISPSIGFPCVAAVRVGLARVPLHSQRRRSAGLPVQTPSADATQSTSSPGRSGASPCAPASRRTCPSPGASVGNSPRRDRYPAATGN